MDRTRIVIVEDHALTREGMKTALAGAADVVGEAADGLGGLDAVVRERPDVAVVDLGLPGIDGIELTRRIRVQSPQTRVVIVTMIDVEEEVLAALGAGADAYCLKSSPPSTLIDAVRIARDGGAYFDPRIAHVVLGRFAPAGRAKTDSPLTAREGDVLRAIAEGKGNAEIAGELHIGLGTVKGHVRDILEKLCAADRTQAAVTALRRGLI
ncbi:MAG TPA: response regulator transcription factor [Candidatus Baltobacteraceae bacterium]|jgi:DNA-binding NarL/FixJ family response regulator|nr:response regulator transcription factor [Candidatus Baltobacteraceae bacterium]